MTDLVKPAALNHNPRRLEPDGRRDSYISLHKSRGIKCKPSLLNHLCVTTCHLSLCGKEVKDLCDELQCNIW